MIMEFSCQRVQIAIIGVPMDLGANRRGVDMGPSAIRYAELITKIEEFGYPVVDYGNLDISLVRGNREQLQVEDLILEIKDVASTLQRKVEEAVTAGYLPLVIGGDHSVAIGTAAGLVQVKDKLGLIWFDAHGDYNTLSTSETNNVHGMVLAVINGQGPAELVSVLGKQNVLAPENIVLVGVRDLDDLERKRLKESAISIYSMSEIDRLGVEQVMKRAIATASNGTEGIYTSLDIDVLDSLVASGVGTLVNDGLTYREAHLALEMIADSQILSLLELVEVNPILDQQNRSAELAVELILSALGNKII